MSQTHITRRNHDKQPIRPPPRGYRTFLVFLGVVLVAQGTAGILTGKIVYPNYWRGGVFAPFAVAMGVLLLYVCIFRWKRLVKNPPRFDEKDRRPWNKPW